MSTETVFGHESVKKRILVERMADILGTMERDNQILWITQLATARAKRDPNTKLESLLRAAVEITDCYCVTDREALLYELLKES